MRVASYSKIFQSTTRSRKMTFCEVVQKFSYAHSEFTIKNLFKNRKKFGLTELDVAVFLYLVSLSRRRIFINLTTAKLADDINVTYSRVAHSIKRLNELNLCKRIDYRDARGFIIHPDVINNGDDKKRAFKFMLWDKK
jgi:predicted transcriptional regulator